jgi:PIN domain nuclease of toxin-antitoxin system
MGKSDSVDALLLDTCAIIYLSSGTTISPTLADEITNRAKSGTVFVSPISAWELGSLTSRGRIALATEPLEFFETFVSLLGATITDLNAEILVKSSFLPGRPHRDPMDRILIATARKNNFALLTNDRAILAFGAEGHVKTLAC